MCSTTTGVGGDSGDDFRHGVWVHAGDGCGVAGEYARALLMSTLEYDGLAGFTRVLLRVWVGGASVGGAPRRSSARTWTGVVSCILSYISVLGGGV